MIIPRRGSHCPARVRRRVSNVTRRRITQIHGRSRLSCAFAAALGLIVALHRHAAAEPHAVDARIVWARADRAYIAASDSISLAENEYRFVRDPGAAATPWPDTIMVGLFGETSDEEIALERGELDVAVFWPGEASARLRADPRWRGFGYGWRGQLVAGVPAGV